MPRVSSRLMEQQPDRSRLLPYLIGAGAVLSLVMLDVYRGPAPAAAMAPPPPRELLVSLATEAERPRPERVVVPVRTLVDRQAPLDRPTPYLSSKENPFSGQTTTEDRRNWSTPDGGTPERSPARETTAEDSKQPATDQTPEPDGSLFAAQRAAVRRFSEMEMEDLRRGRVFQELPSERDLAPEVLVNFDSRGRISLGTMAYKHADYFFAMVRKISEKWHMYFPVMQHYYGLMRGGEVLVVFDLDLDGRVVAARVEKSYGQPTLDRACLQAITEAADFGPIPGEFRERGKLI